MARASLRRGVMPDPDHVSFGVRHPPHPRQVLSPSPSAPARMTVLPDPGCNASSRRRGLAARCAARPLGKWHGPSLRRGAMPDPDHVSFGVRHPPHPRQVRSPSPAASARMTALPDPGCNASSRRGVWQRVAPPAASANGTGLVTARRDALPRSRELRGQASPSSAASPLAFASRTSADDGAARPRLQRLVAPRGLAARCAASRLGKWHGPRYGAA